MNRKGACIRIHLQLKDNKRVMFVLALKYFTLPAYCCEYISSLMILKLDEAENNEYVVKYRNISICWVKIQIRMYVALFKLYIDQCV